MKRRVYLELVSAVVGIERSLIDNHILSDEERARVAAALKRLDEGEPLEYITGRVDFLTVSLEITPAVLIPRVETEEMATLILERIKGKEGALLDLCSGSGALGLGLKKNRPDLHVTLSDLSQEAVNLSKRNQERNELEVEILQGDLCLPLRGRLFDFIVSNPPYISREDWAGLERSVKEFEPVVALIGGEDGLDFYRKMSQELPPFLKSGGKVFLEIGDGQGPAIKEIFSCPPWCKEELLLDLFGRERFFFLEKG